MFIAIKEMDTTMQSQSFIHESVLTLNNKLMSSTLIRVESAAIQRQIRGSDLYPDYYLVIIFLIT